MEKIAEYLQDPGWWFSAFFVAVFASLLAGYLKLPISKIFSLISTRVRIWRDNQLQQFEKRAQRIGADGTLLLIVFIRALALLMFFLIGLAVVIALFSWYTFPKKIDIIAILNILFFFVIIVFLMFVGYKEGYFIRLANRAQDYYSKNTKEAKRNQRLKLTK
jgi:hypothetical protein